MISYPLKIEAIPGEPLRFRVESESGATGADTYLVDLEEFGGNGQCGCPQFEFRLGKQLKEGKRIGQDTRCKHIRIARVFALDAIIKQAQRNT